MTNRVNFCRRRLGPVYSQIQGMAVRLMNLETTRIPKPGIVIFVVQIRFNSDNAHHCSSATLSTKQNMSWTNI